jgi:hypothetical protein
MSALVELVSIVADEGTVVLFSGLLYGPEGPVAVAVGVDHRMAQPIVDALSAGIAPVVEAESWQILGFGGVAGAPPTTLKSTSRRVR